MKNYVISDIHGCAKTFKALLDKIALRKNDNLYLLGDYIDRGNDSAGVLDTLIDLTNSGYQIFPLRGNHEEHILNAEKEYDQPTFVHFVKKINKSGNLLDENRSLKSKYRSFLKDLPYYYELDNFILVHAGLNLTIPDPYQDTTTMLDLRNFFETFNHPKIGTKRIIHGHVPNEINHIKETIEKQKQIIPLDNGCVYTKKHKIYDHTKLGNLLCLELNKFELIIQKNIDID